MKMKKLLLLVVLVLLSSVLLSVSAQPGPGLKWITTVETGEDLPNLVAWSPDGRLLAYGTETETTRKKITYKSEEEIHTYPSEVWVTDLKKKPERILKRKRFRDYKGRIPSFRVTGLAWSSDSQKIAVELTDDEGETGTFLLTAEGKTVKIGGGRSNFLPDYGAGWLSDNETLGTMSEAVGPRLLHRIGILRVTAGRHLWLFREKVFAAVAWLRGKPSAVLVERDKEFSETPRLVQGNLENGQLVELGEVPDYLGKLTVSADEAKIAYFVGQEKLAVRSFAGGEPEYWPVPLGRYEWASGSRGVLFIEPKEIGDAIGWLSFYDAKTSQRVRLLEEVSVFELAVASNGRVAVLTADGFPELRIYQLELP